MASQELGPLTGREQTGKAGSSTEMACRWTQKAWPACQDGVSVIKCRYLSWKSKGKLIKETTGSSPREE